MQAVCSAYDRDSTEGITDNRSQEFMRGLTALSMKHGISIKGCGCCGSPFCCEIEAGKHGEYVFQGDSSDLQWVEAAAHGGGE